MADEIQKFDPSTLMQGVKDRIKATFVSLIPDEQWEQMVKKEVDGFFKLKDLGYVQRSSTSDFQILVNSELEKEAKKRLEAYLTSDEFNTVWRNHGAPACSEAVKRMILDNAGAVMASMYGEMAQQFIQNFANTLRSRSY